MLSQTPYTLLGRLTSFADTCVCFPEDDTKLPSSAFSHFARGSLLSPSSTARLRIQDRAVGRSKTLLLPSAWIPRHRCLLRRGCLPDNAILSRTILPLSVVDTAARHPADLWRTRTSTSFFPLVLSYFVASPMFLKNSSVHGTGRYLISWRVHPSWQKETVSSLVGRVPNSASPSR